MKTTLLGFLTLFAITLSGQAAVIFSDTFQGGGTLDSNHWSLHGNADNGDGYASFTKGSFLAVNGGTKSPDNDSQGSFVHGKDSWSPSVTHRIDLTLAPPVMTTQGNGGVYFSTSWFWISEGAPDHAYPIYATNERLLVKVFQSNGDNSTTNLVQIFRRTGSETYEGYKLWEGQYSITGPYPSLAVEVEINNTDYTVTFNQTMTNTSGNLSGQHGMTLTNPLYAALGTSNYNVGRGEGRFVNFSIESVPEPGVVGLLILAGTALVSVRCLGRRRRETW